MQYDLPPLANLHAFEAAARHNSFSAAAEELNLSQSAISHRIRSLENHLGYTLFDRLPRSLILNDMGRAYLPSVQRAFNELSTSTSGLFGKRRPKMVTIRVPITQAVLWLAPRIEQFLVKHPDIDVRIGSAIWADQITREETDLEIRFGNGNWAGFDTSLLQQEVAIPVCSQQHLDLFGSPKTLNELSKRKRINTLGYDDLWSKLFLTTDIVTNNDSNSIWVDTTLSAIEIAAAGTRCAMVPLSLIESGAIRNRLLQIYDISVPMNEALYLLTPSSRSQISPQTQLLREWLLDQSKVS